MGSEGIYSIFSSTQVGLVCVCVFVYEEAKGGLCV